MKYQIVFSDVDGTLLNSRHKVLPGTLAAIHALQEKGIPFVIISARSPSGISPIMKENAFRCSMICYSGALAFDEKGTILFSSGLPPAAAAEVVSFIEASRFDCTWNLYSLDTWLVKDKSDPRILREEAIVHAQARQGTIASLEKEACVNKILCICNPTQISHIEQRLKTVIPALSIVKSSDILLEIMEQGVTKGSAVTRLCKLWNIPLESAVAFGDHFNDAEMLEAVGTPFLMGNAPAELKKRFPQVTLDHNREGICQALEKIGLVEKGNF